MFSRPGADLGIGLLVIVGAGLLALVGYQLYRRYGGDWTATRDFRNGDDGWRLGPWPVIPSAVATRQDVIGAFKYLSLLKFGVAAQSWNHLDIADRLGGDSAERRRIADNLAGLYERTVTLRTMPFPKTPSLPRTDICFLAGVTTA